MFGRKGRASDRLSQQKGFMVEHCLLSDQMSSSVSMTGQSAV